MTEEFKVGDKVYFPSEREQVYTLRAYGNKRFPFFIEDDSIHRAFTLHGRFLESDKRPSILHATPENHELLCKLYGVEFEAPPEPKTPKEVIQAMLDDGWTWVPCYVSDCHKHPSNTHCADLIVSVSGKSFRSSSDVCWQFATPIDPRTGKVIIDFNDETGEIITE